MTLRASMKHGWIAIALSCGACAGGGNTAEPAATPGQPKPPAVAPRNARDAAKPAAAAPAPTPAPAAASAAAGDSAEPAIPAGARWTIFCESITTEDHFARANALKEVLMKNAKARGWYVIHQEGRSSIYLGYYREIDPDAAGKDAAARADAQRAKSDKQIVESIPNPRAPDRKLFPRAQFAQLDAPDPDAPAGWSLTNAPGYWSVQVAAFTGGDRKQNAVQAVREARAMNVEAYYYHGESTSSVCVGHWRAEALKRQSANTGTARNEDETIVVNLAPSDLTPQERAQMAATGGNIRELKARVEILDESLRSTLREYPEHAVDGAVQMVRGTDSKTGRTIERPAPSFIVRIPRSDARAVEPTYEAAAPSGPRAPVGAPRPDLGARLRGIGQ